MGGITHIIFDCDGVLVDSEMLSADVLMQMMAEIGLPISPEIFRDDFLGRSFSSASERIARRFGRPMPPDFQLQYRTRLLDRMRRDLKPMEGVLTLMAALKAPYWLATSSSPQRLDVALHVTGLARWFTGRCSTASEVLHGKPAPDLMLLAAENLGALPAACLVIEDSEMGLQAAQAAGMTAWNFAGGSHYKSGYQLPPMALVTRRLDSMQELQVALADAGLC